MKNLTMKNLTMKSSRNVLFAMTAVFLLVPAGAFAGGGSSCSFKVYNCSNVTSYTHDADVNVHVFDGNDSSHVWATYEHASLGKARYAEVKCNYSDCDTTIYRLDKRVWVNNTCKDIFLTGFRSNLKASTTKYSECNQYDPGGARYPNWQWKKD